MIYQRLSKRQLLAMTWWMRPAFRDLDAIICDGSVRSGKTLCMADGFLLWSMHTFNGQKFAICGKTIEGLRRNVILNLQDWMGGVLTIQEKRAENKLVVTYKGKTNTYFLFGGRDESSYTLIQGMTLAGVLLDEVALMPRSFVEQALARCSVPGSKFWFNCNPEGPEHWFFQEWVKKCKERKALHLHFTMADNLALDKEVRERYERMYSGIFYDRYIRGEWCVAEGRIYDMFDKSKHVVSAPPEVCTQYYISMDYGTQNPTAMLLWGKSDGAWYLVKEYYYNGRAKRAQKTDEEYYNELDKLAGDLAIHTVIVDPSAASMIACIRRHGRFFVAPADNAVLDGIRVTATALSTGKIKICECCTNTLAEIEEYVWDDKAAQRGEDKPLKINDHAMDAMRYFCMRVLKTQGKARVAKNPYLRG